MTPRLEILPPRQRDLWPALSRLPEHFVLYGGTGIALRLATRQSIDFDFFTDRPFSADALIRDLPFLSGAQLLQAAPNTATFSTSVENGVKLSFFGGLTFGRVGIPERCEDNGVWIASLADLAAQKMKDILTRAEAKDYLDIHAMIQAGITLPQALGSAQALYPEFNPLLSLKALTYYEEPALATVPAAIREALASESAKVNIVPPIARISPTISIAPSR